MAIVITADVVKNLAQKMQGRIAAALTTAMQDTLFKQKEVAPVAFANGQSEYGWPISFQSATVKPKGKIQGGTMKRSITGAVDKLKLAAVFRCQMPYAVWVHEGTSRFVGRPFLTRPIREVGIPALRKALVEQLAKSFT